ncbi:uncharacterized protein EI97DRAFT_46308 [Westerdykella ornata]|uniref:Uncharacterized protein n=1 Tax=Westerdykella ornata TaxID=318751 RepID=A0A6A6JIV0_WESOR|nr:uncharacterized protein EI97DRAFT_46308 [Westerdykella ornata]KAF2276033.1 hypothetical protein EI97DRAFT_46308 [Westerdykella ornata]
MILIDLPEPADNCNNNNNNPRTNRGTRNDVSSLNEASKFAKGLWAGPRFSMWTWLISAGAAGTAKAKRHGRLINDWDEVSMHRTEGRVVALPVSSGDWIGLGVVVHVHVTRPRSRRRARRGLHGRGPRPWHKVKDLLRCSLFIAAAHQLGNGIGAHTEACSRYC